MRRAEADRRGVEPDRLVAPGAVERVLGDRHQLDMGEAHVGDVVDQLLGVLLVAERPVAVVGHALPRAQMHLVGRDRRVDALGLLARVHPVLVVPAIAAQVAHHARGLGRVLRAEAHRVGLQRQQPAVAGDDLVLVERAFSDIGQEDLPYARGPTAAHRVAPAVPAVEVSHHRDALRVRRPDGEMRALRALVLHHMRAQRRPEPLVRALAQQVLVHLADHRAEAVWILAFPLRTPPAAAQAIVALGHRPHEQAVMARIGLQRFGLLALLQNLHLLGAGVVDAQHAPGSGLMWTQNPEGIRMEALGDHLGILGAEQVADIGRLLCHWSSVSTVPKIARSMLALTRPLSRCPAHNRGWCGRTRTSPSARC